MGLEHWSCRFSPGSTLMLAGFVLSNIPDVISSTTLCRLPSGPEAFCQLDFLSVLCLHVVILFNMLSSVAWCSCQLALSQVH